MRLFRVQRSFIVNLREVLLISRAGVILKSGVAVPISRGMADKIGKKIIKLINRKIERYQSVSDIDLCVIIGNLLDNAIEENKRLEKDAQFYLSVTNAAGKKQTKYGGYFSADSESGGFTAEILIPLTSKDRS